MALSYFSNFSLLWPASDAQLLPDWVREAVRILQPSQHFDQLGDGTRSVRKNLEKHQTHSAHMTQSSAKKKSRRDVATAPLKGTEADEPLALKEPESGTKSAATYFVSDPPPHAVGPAVRAFFVLKKSRLQLAR